MYEIYQGISHPGCIPAYPGYGYMNRDLWQTITSSHLVLHTKPGRIKNFKLSGVTRQVETTGAQLFDASKLLTHSQGGATVTNNGDGSFTVSGNGTLTSGFSHAIYLENEEVRRLFRPGEIYMAESPTATRPYFEVGFFKNDQNVCDIRPVSAFLKATLPDDFFAPENNLRVRYIFYGASGLDIIPGTIKPMLYQDGDGTWEPYTGTQSSPSPEYPQDIQGVGVRTAQMLDFTKVITYGWCALVDADTGTIKCDIVNDYYCVLKITYLNDYIMAHKGGNLTFYADQPLDTWLSIIIDGTRSSGKTYQEATGKGKIVKATIADDFTSVRFMELRLNRKSSAFTDTDTVIPNIMLCEGTAVLPYEPYGYRTDVVTRSKNLLDRQRMLDFILQKSGASIVQFDGRRCLKLDGGFNFPDFNLYEDFEPEKRYTLTYDGFYEKYKTEAFLSNGFAFTLQNGGRNLSLMDVSDIGTWKHKTTTSDTGVSKLTFTYGVSSVVYIDLDTIQLEEGTISTPYQPYAYYTAPIYTREPVFQGDKIEYRNGEYGLVRKNGLLTDNGVVDWGKYNYAPYGINRCFNTKVPDMIYYANGGVAVNEKPVLLCNGLPLGGYIGRDKPVSVGYSEGQLIYIRLDDDKYADIDTVDQFKAWLADHPVEILYPLEQEVWEPLPAISQQALRNLPTYKGTTIIDTTDPLEPEITVSYIPQKKNFFNLDKVFDNLAGGTIYKKYSLGLSPGNYRWSLQENEFYGSGKFALFTDDLEFIGDSYATDKIYDWIGHSTSELYCHTSGSFVVRDVMYIALDNKKDIDTVKQLLKTLIIEKI